MAVVKRQPTADSDLFEIWRYVAEDSIPAADQLIRKIDETFQLLAENPEMGTRREELGDDIRAFPVEKYVIFYRPRDREEGITVGRVLNAAKNISSSDLE